MNDKLMEEALALAAEAAEAGEVPVGCVIADRNGIIIGRGRNRREEKHDASSHAEIEAIREACDSIEDWRLDGCSLYVTLEPCPMCAGAVINSRISEVVFAARDPVMGSCGSVIDLFCENYPHSPRVFRGIAENESRELLHRFFENKRRSSFD